MPLLPLRSALRAAQASGHPRFDPWETADQAPRVLDAWLEEVTASRPVALLVDDLQWADQSTLDVLMYLAAGPRDRRVALVVTVRSHSLSAGHPLHRWLADVLRLPGVSQLHLGALDRTGTAAQLTYLLNGPPHQSLVDDVFAHTRGNAYLNSLVVRGLSPGVRRLPRDLPPDLTTAVRGVWHLLSPAARALTSLVAVGGRPERPEVLRAVAAAAGLGLGDVLRPLQEAVELGILEPVDEDRYWFHHPVQPQVLVQALTSGQRRRWHGAYAHHAERLLATGVPVTLETSIATGGQRAPRATAGPVAGHRSRYRRPGRHPGGRGPRDAGPGRARSLARASGPASPGRPGMPSEPSPSRGRRETPRRCPSP